jgi:hypothetical protein
MLSSQSCSYVGKCRRPESDVVEWMTLNGTVAGLATALVITPCHWSMLMVRNSHFSTDLYKIHD